MGYADGLLSTGERIVHREKQHWFVFIWGARYTILAVIVAVVAARPQEQPDASRGRTSSTTPRSPCSSAVWRSSLWTILQYINLEYVSPIGGSSRSRASSTSESTDCSLEKINDAVLTQSIFGRIFGFGDLDILTASESGISRFRMLVQPVEFKRAMLDAKHEYERDIAGRGYAASPPLRSGPHRPGASATPPTDDTVSTPLPPAATPRAARRCSAGRGDPDAQQPRRPARPRRDQCRGVRAQEGRPARPSLTRTGRAATIRGTR